MSKLVLQILVRFNESPHSTQNKIIAVLEKCFFILIKSISILLVAPFAIQ